MWAVRIAAKGTLWAPSSYSSVGSVQAELRMLDRPQTAAGGSLVSNLATQSVAGERVTIGWQVASSRYVRASRFPL